MRGGPHQRRKRRQWHRKPRGKNFARYLGRQSKIKQKEHEIRRLDLLIGDADRKRDEAANRARYHQMRVENCRDTASV